jgi:putative peptide zinc metalloprotease protein
MTGQGRRALPKVRSDLSYTPDPENPAYCFIKDPIRQQFFRFNQLQVALMQRLDGRTSYEELVEIIGATFEVTVDVPKIERMVERFRTDLLLDVTSYRVDSERDRELIRNALRKKDVMWRAGGKGRVVTTETILFQEGVRQIEQGDPCEAGHYFEEVLAINPANERARLVLETLHTAFFRRHRHTPSHLMMLSLWNPDQFLTWLDRRVGKYVFSPWIIVFVGLLTLITIGPLVDLSLPSIDEFGWFDIAIYLPLFLVWITLHELAHGFACKHYGGVVQDIGILLMYGVLPGAYCDTSDTYLFRDRKAKVVVSLAGVTINWIFNLLTILTLYLSSEGFFLRNVLTILLIHTLWLTFSNLVPFIKLDGYYALSDYLNLVNLQERSFEHLATSAKRGLLGIEPDPSKEQPTRRERWIFSIYAISSGIYTGTFIYGIWISLLLPWAIEYLGALGLVITVLYAIKTLRTIIVVPGIAIAKLLAQHRAAALEPRRATAFALTAVAAYSLLAIEWPFYVDGLSEVHPNRRAVVTASEPGLITEILVEEGRSVEVGQPIARLENPELALERAQAALELDIAQLEHEILLLGPRQEELAVARAKALGASVQARYATLEASRRKALSDEGVESLSSAMSAARESSARAGERAQEALSVRLMVAGARSEDVEGSKARVRQLEARLAELDVKVARLEIVSPIRGVLVGYRFQELEGSWLARGERLCEVHDLDRVRLEVRIAPSDMFGEVRPGQRTAVRSLGDPLVPLEASVALVRPRAGLGSEYVVELSSVRNPGWTTGMTGHARIYGDARSIAFRTLGVPVLRLVEHEAWKIIGG